MRTRIGLIGCGRFGLIAARYCAPFADVLVHDVRPPGRLPRGARRATLREAAAQPVVILAVPISRMRRVLGLVAPAVRPGALVLDVCSVKSAPVRWMERILPASVAVVGTHPLFGPASDTGRLSGQKIIVCPARGAARRMAGLRRLARAHGVRLAVMSPAAHDRLMAETLLVTQYVARLLERARIPLRSGSTPSYDHLRAVVRAALGDTEQLFLDMWRFNPRAPRIGRALGRAHRALLAKTRIDI